jgi:hypothetical protein
MAERLGPIRVECDAPPYGIVRACSEVDFVTPLDVRWCHVRHFLSRNTTWRNLLLGMDGTCSCGQPLPVLEAYLFTVSTGEEYSYLLGQCSRCRTIFWDRP